MSKKVLCVLLLFVCALVYLHQKVTIYVEAYNLNNAFADYNKLVDARDNLLYNLSGEVNLAKINQWVERNGFTFAKEQNVYALALQDKQAPGENKRSNDTFASSFIRMIRSSGISSVLAQERR